MSCFIMKAESIRDIADFMHVIVIGGYNNEYGVYPTREILDELGSKTRYEIYEKLYQMNIDAYKARYSDVEDVEIPDIPAVVFKIPIEYGTRKWLGGYLKAMPEHYRLLKKLECYLYQCDEGNIYERDLFKGMRDIANQLTLLIVTGTEEYQSAEWG